MARTPTALVTPSVLTWARTQARLSVPEAAKKIKTSEGAIESWEANASKPTLRQARLLASAYRVPFAAFYLDQPPAAKPHVPKDLRRLAGTLIDGLSSTISLDVRDAWEKREIALELLAAQGTRLRTFPFRTTLRENTETAGTSLREALKLGLSEQNRWRDARKGFNALRSLAESAGVLVLQTSDIPLAELRAYSLYTDKLPVVVLNRKDAPAGRSFSLLHELTHLGLHSEGICDLTTEGDRPPEDQRLEIFCNAVAAAALLPADAVLSSAIVRSHGTSPIWTDDEIVALCRQFSSSREALLRRLLTFELTTQAFYKLKREEYAQEYASRPKERAIVLPPADAISLLGKPFVRLVLDSLDRGTVTTSDAADYLGLRLKHLPALVSSLEGE